MELLVRNAEGNLTQSDREYAAVKLGRLDRFFHQATRVEIVHREHKRGHRVEVTVFADGLTVRGEETDENILAAIDIVSEKLDQRLRRLKNRIVHNHRQRGRPVPAHLEVEPEIDPHDVAVQISERKQFLLKPLNVDEAALQMELIDHPFFVFRNERSGNLEVLYKRKDGKYGLIQPEA